MIRINKFSFELIVCLFLMRRFTLFLLAALATTSVHAAAYLKNDDSTVDPIQYTGWSAYNDLGGNLSTGNVTNISGPGNDRPAGSLSPAGTLVKYFDNSSTGITLAISGTSGSWNFHPELGHPLAGDAFTLFDGYLDANGMSDFRGPITYNFTDLDPNEIYDIALYSAVVISFPPLHARSSSSSPTSTRIPTAAPRGRRSRRPRF